jgi:hypothetical protein
VGVIVVVVVLVKPTQDNSNVLTVTDWRVITSVLSLSREILSQVTSNVGLYYVCYQLAKRGWNVMPTSRNAIGVDIIIYNYDARGTPYRQGADQFATNLAL